MAPTEPFDIGPVGEDAMDGAMALVAEAGWNQRPADWRLFMAHGTVFGLRDAGRLIGTAALMPYGARFAWIGMVLVAKDARGQGIGSALLRHCIAALAPSGRTAVLDATPAGEPIYRALGFAGEMRITRWQGEAGPAEAGAPDGTAPLQAADAAGCAAAREAAVFGADRGALLADFARRLPAACRDAAGRGAVFGRDGRVASQIGPLVADDDATALRLLDAALGALEGPVFIDLLDTRAALADRLRDRGFTAQRPFLRMARPSDGADGAQTFGDPRRLYAIAGPEFG